MKYFLITILAVSSLQVRADSGDSLKNDKPRYVFTVNSSMSFCSQCSNEGSLVAMPFTIHALQLKRWRIGAGVGYTSFASVRVMPWFGSVTLNLFKKKKNGMFIECNYGAGHAWVAPAIRESQNFKKATAADFFQISTGYAWHYYKLRLAAQIGYQSLKTSRRYEYGTGYSRTFLASSYYEPPASMTIDYLAQRLFLSISFGL